MPKRHKQMPEVTLVKLILKGDWSSVLTKLTIVIGCEKVDVNNDLSIKKASARMAVLT
jgi:hypothetical protein